MESPGENWLAWDKNRIDFAIPSEVPSGEYLVCIEHLALHRPSGTEFYFNCAHVKVTNSGSDQEPTDVVKIPGVYDSSTKGLSPNYSIYNGATSYPMPGPAVFGGSGSGSGSGAAASNTGASEPAATAPSNAGFNKIPQFSRRYHRGN